MTDRLQLHAIGTTGADATNDTPRYNPATDRLEFAPGSTGGGSLAVNDEGVQVVATAARLNFTGAGVTATDAGLGEVNIAIPGGTTGSGSSEVYEDVVTALPNKVHRWKFDEAAGATVADSIGSLPLTLSGTYTRAVAGPSGATSATSFGATAKAMSTGLGSNPTGAAPRCQVVIYRHNGALSEGILLSYGTSGSRGWWTPAVSTSESQSFRCMTFGDDLNISNTTALDKEWHLAAFGFDGDRTVLAYLDGVVYAHRMGAALVTTATGNFTVGASTASSGYLLGDVDDVIVTTSWPGKPLLDRLAKSLGLLG